MMRNDWLAVAFLIVIGALALLVFMLLVRHG